MSTVKDVTKKEVNVDDQKRAFMKKFGKYAAVGVGMSMLMGPGVSTANAYGGKKARRETRKETRRARKEARRARKEARK